MLLGSGARAAVSRYARRPVLSAFLLTRAGLAPNSTRSHMNDPHYRSLLKAVSWRATGTVDTIVVSFLLTGRIKLAFSIGCVEFFTKIGLYYFHERIWNRVPSGT